MWSNSPLFCEKSSNSVECLASSYLWPISMLNPVFRKQKSTYPPKNNIKKSSPLWHLFHVPNSNHIVTYCSQIFKHLTITLNYKYDTVSN